MMKANLLTVCILLSLAVAAVHAADNTSSTGAAQGATQGDQQKLLEESQVNQIVNKILSSDLSGKSADEVKAMIKEEIKKEQEKRKAEVYHHVHRTTRQAEDASTEEVTADEALRLGHKKGLYTVKHEINKAEDEEQKKAADEKQVLLDPETQRLQKKYEKLLKKLLDESGKDGKKKPSKLELIRSAEKEMQKKQATKPVKTSDRMIAYMEELLRQLNGGTLKNADKFDMKGFVSSIFRRYRDKHEQEKERKRRIIALREHLARERRANEHQPNFYDEFYTPNENGYDTNFLMRPLAPHQTTEETVLQTSVLPHPDKLTLSAADREAYLGYEHHSDHTHKPLNMPLVAPDNREVDYLEQVLGL